MLIPIDLDLMPYGLYRLHQQYLMQLTPYL
jgi:hypothetical protein